MQNGSITQNMVTISSINTQSNFKCVYIDMHTFSKTREIHIQFL